MWAHVYSDVAKAIEALLAVNDFTVQALGASNCELFSRVKSAAGNRLSGYKARLEQGIEDLNVSLGGRAVDKVVVRHPLFAGPDPALRLQTSVIPALPGAFEFTKQLELMHERIFLHVSIAFRPASRFTDPISAIKLGYTGFVYRCVRLIIRCS